MKKSLLNAINNVKTLEEMSDVIDLVNLRQKQLLKEARAIVKASIEAGSKVKISTRDNGVLNGVVVEVRRTKATVTIPNFKGRPNGRYTVSLSQLKAA
tara:strand:+ start:781 stop:1074 length:294 start_codon:yes stop_codon:yes gene_type:complete